MKSLRQVAIWLTRRTSRTLPPSQRQWAAAMRGELDQIDGDGEALRWAIGCFFASYVERIKAQPIIELFPIRAFITLVLAWHVFNDLFASALTFAYRTQHFTVASELGRLTASGDYRPLVPLLDTVPFWILALSILAASAYAVAGLRYLRRMSSPLVPFVVGFVLDIVVWLSLQTVQTSTGVNATNGNGFLFFCIATVLPFAALWKRSSAQLTR